MTRGGIEYDLQKSPYNVQAGEYIYTFSSQKNADRFKSRLQMHRDKIARSLCDRFNISARFDLIADLGLYRDVEKRGFLIRDGKGGEISCREQVKLNGQLLSLNF